jgi:hypothetical protein
MTAFEYEHQIYHESSQDDTSSDHEIIDRIASQIAKGVEVTPYDVQALAKVAFADSPSSFSTTMFMEDCSVTTKASIPLLDQKYLQDDHIERVGRVKLVRYVGMVQDMLETEYYVSTDRSGKATHYRDVANGVMSEEEEDFMMGASLGERLAERTPLVVVPIPFASEWLVDMLKKQKRGASAADSTSADSDIMIENEAPEEDRSCSKKRSRDTEMSEPLLSKRRIEDSENNISAKTTTTSPFGCDRVPPPNSCGSCKDQEVSTSTDWWPSGCMGSDTDQCPVLAKLYYDRLSNQNSAPTTRKLRLNDLVEFVGIVSVDPTEADFSNQQSSSQIVHQHASSMMEPGFSYFEEDVLGGDCTVLPPPSQLPRLHVLCYNLLDLDQLGKSLIRKTRGHCEEMEEENEEQPSLTLSEGTDYRRQAIQMLASEPALCNNTVVAEATLLTLLSMAQRRLNPSTDEHFLPSWDFATAPTESATIGCASLDIQLPSELASRQFFVRFQSLLHDLCPVVAGFDITREALNNGRLLQAPSKDGQGRLVPSLLQLPKGATVLLHIGHMSEGALSPQGQETLAALQSMVQHHVVPYAFGSTAMKYNFEADYRVIVVSVANGEKENWNRPGGSRLATRSKLLKCALQVQLGQDEMTSLIATDGKDCNDEDSISTRSRRKGIREFLSARRYVVEDDTCQSLPGGSNNISLSHTVLKVAQEEFIKRRGNATNKTVVDNGPSVGEDDLHRWLTLTRLQARSRNNATGSNGTANSRQAAITQDWERALVLDDIMAESARR